mmetsp:Transcript_13427/g.41467  ORF Transcript_13427/g.41467 Transcript_13427/m.41467 type:complete len:233 (+) Transcript_13427:86-784(+)
MRPAAPSGRSFWYWRPAPLPPTKSASQSPSKRFAGSTKPSSRTPAWIVKSRTISSQPGGSSTRVSHARTGRNPRRPPCSVIHSKRGCAGSSHWGSSSSTRQQSDIVSWWYGALSLPRGKPMPALTATFRRENVLPVTCVAETSPKRPNRHRPRPRVEPVRAKVAETAAGRCRGRAATRRRPRPREDRRPAPSGGARSLRAFGQPSKYPRCAPRRRRDPLRSHWRVRAGERGR